MRVKQNLLSTVVLLEAFGLTLEQLIADEKIAEEIKGELSACVGCVQNQQNKIVVVKAKDRDVCFPLKMIEWIEADTCYTKFHLIDIFLCNKDWRGFDRRYNGPGFEKNHYDKNLAATYEKYCKS